MTIKENVTEDYILATEKLYQAIIENKKIKGGDRMKKGVKIGLYVASFVLIVLILALFDYIFDKSIDWPSAIILASVFTVADIVGGKKYIENKSGEQFTKKQSINHFIITILIMVIALFGYYSIKQIYVGNKEPNNNALEISVKKSLIDIANNEYTNNGNYIYAESHKILDSEIKNDEVYVYVVANYGLFNKNNNEISSVDSKKCTLTMIYQKGKNNTGIYELKDYKEDEIPDNLKEKANVNYEDTYFKEQLNSYNN